jgi:hypothetical protein
MEQIQSVLDGSYIDSLHVYIEQRATCYVPSKVLCKKLYTSFLQVSGEIFFYVCKCQNEIFFYISKCMHQCMHIYTRLYLSIFLPSFLHVSREVFFMYVCVCIYGCMCRYAYLYLYLSIYLFIQKIWIWAWTPITFGLHFIPVFIHTIIAWEDT